jgi:hypothetical protein
MRLVAARLKPGFSKTVYETRSKRRLMFQRMTSTVLCLVLLGLTSALAQENTFADRLLKNRYLLNVQEGRLSGTGLPVLQNALAGAQFVLIGEDHGISQIPQFAGAVCDLTGPQGFHTMAVETGPLAANELQQWITRGSGRVNLVDFEKKFPETIAFYNFQEEYEMLSRCARSAQGGKFHLWGLDQELMGSSGLILTRILETHPGKQAADEVQRLLLKNDEAHAAAAKSGSPGDIFMMIASDDELNQLRDLLRKQGNATSQALIDALIKSRDIYQKNMNGSGYDSNRERALLMKSNFANDYKQATQAEGTPPKVLLKTGAWHMYKGINPLRNNDMGNFITEFADGQGATSLHILILGVSGSQLRFAGIGHPYQPGDFNLAQDKDSDFLFLKPMFDNLESDGWTMFDLRGLRKEFRSLEPVDKELERMIFGYDLLVLIPNATPSKQIQ